MTDSSSLQIYLANNNDEKKTSEEDHHQKEEGEEERSHFDSKYKKIMSKFPRGKDWSEETQLYHYQDFWYMEFFLQGLLSAQDHFKPRSTDIILASFMKTGTTWLKALALAIATRSSTSDDSASPLLKKNPHDCMPFMEVDHHQSRGVEIPLVGTHCPYTSLPESAINCGCKIVYIWRDSKDVFVSLWFFFTKLFTLMGLKPRPIEETFELFCNGYVNYGPYWDHVLGYWRAKLEFPDRVLFLKYEEMKKDTSFYVREIADFMGYSFSLEEEEGGVVEKIVDMCSFEKLSNLEVNKNGKHRENTEMAIENNIFFRKGEVGDWQSHLTPEMGARLDQIMNRKLMGSGLTIS